MPAPQAAGEAGSAAGVISEGPEGIVSEDSEINSDTAVQKEGSAKHAEDSERRMNMSAPPEPAGRKFRMRKKDRKRMKTFMKKGTAVVLAALAALIAAVCGAESPNGAEAVSPGDVVVFGSYEQDNDPGNGPEGIEWIVLEAGNGQAKLISRYALDARPYNTEAAEVTWETCSLRAWLNGDFLNAAFSAEEQTQLCTVTVPAVKMYETSTDPGNDTRDRVFLLNATESESFLGLKEVLICRGTEYVRAARIPKNGEGNVNWLLRSPGRDHRTVGIVTYYGTVQCGEEKAEKVNAVRPAVVVKTAGIDPAGITSGVYTEGVTRAAARARADLDSAALKDLCIRAENGEIPVLPGEAVITGKLAFYIHDTNSLDYNDTYASFREQANGEPFMDVPEEMLAKNLDEADTALFIFPVYENVGRYRGSKNGAVGVRCRTRVIVMDLRQNGIYKAWDAVILDPPKTAEVSADQLAVRARFAPEEAVALAVEKYTPGVQP